MAQAWTTGIGGQVWQSVLDGLFIHPREGAFELCRDGLPHTSLGTYPTLDEAKVAYLVARSAGL